MTVIRKVKKERRVKDDDDEKGEGKKRGKE